MPSRSKSVVRHWVVKAGSNIICTGGPLLIRSWMQQIAQLKKQFGIQVVWVTSGAIASAVDRTSIQKTGKTLSEKQALSAIGQPLVMDLYNLALQTNGLLGAQILLTYDDLSHAKRRQNFKNTLKQLLEWQVVPILNENDAVSTEEIQFGDNDSLSAKVARFTQAERLVILTDVNGLYDRDPATDSSAKLISQIKTITPKVLALSNSNSRSGRGRGGMLSKLIAAKEAGRGGIPTWIVKGDRSGVLLEIARDQNIGTRVSKSHSRSRQK